MMPPIVPKRVVIALHRIDYRRQWNGLLAECYRLGFNPYDGDCVVFIKSDRTQLRILSGDRRGLFLVARRFEGGALRLGWAFRSETETRPISPAEIALLLEGATFTIHRRVKDWK